MASDGLRGLRILVVEDEAIVAMLVEDMLTDMGCIVVDVAGSVEKGLLLAKPGGPAFDGAVLDVNIGGTKVFPIAEVLASRGIPFVFATGYGIAGLDGRYPERTTVAKPFREEALRGALLKSLDKGLIRRHRGE